MAERTPVPLSRTQLVQHYLVEALAPTDIAEVSREARGSTLPPVGPVARWASRAYDALAVGGIAYSQSAAGALAVHVVFAKGAEAISIGSKVLMRNGQEVYRRYVDNGDDYPPSF